MKVFIGVAFLTLLSAASWASSNIACQQIVDTELARVGLEQTKGRSRDVYDLGTRKTVGQETYFWAEHPPRGYGSLEYFTFGSVDKYPRQVPFMTDSENIQDRYLKYNSTAAGGPPTLIRIFATDANEITGTLLLQVNKECKITDAIIISKMGDEISHMSEEACKTALWNRQLSGILCQRYFPQSKIYNDKQ